MHGVKRLFSWMIPRFDSSRFNVSLVSLRRKDLSEETLDAHGGLRDHAATLDAAARACDAVTRLFESGDPSPPVFHLLQNELALLISKLA